MRLLRLQKHPPPGAREGSVIVYADEDGALKQVASDGTRSDLGGESPGGSQPFTPTDLDGLALWLDASTLALADDDPVATWPDASDSGFDATQADTDLQPVCKTAVMNGLRVVRFAASPDAQFLALSGAGLGLFRDLDGCTIAAVAGNATSTDSYPVVFACAAADDTVRRAGLEIHGDNVAIIFGSNDDTGDTDSGTTNYGPGGSNPPSPTVAACGSVAWQMGAAVIQASLPSDEVTIVFGDTPGPTLDSDSQKVYIGAATDGSTGSDIDYAEIIVYQRVLNATERRQVLEYLSSKWATL